MGRLPRLRPAVVAGDFNAAQGAGEETMLLHAGGGRYRVAQVFWPVVWPIQRVTVGAENPSRRRSDDAPVSVDLKAA
jgi:endonuclease/exonuclease/phosphatase family metal-dependent hydrolase